VDQILAEKYVDNGADETVQWTLTDHLNTLRDIAKYDPGSDMTTVVNHLIYDAFGRVASESNPTQEGALLFEGGPLLVRNSLFLFTGRPGDSHTQPQRKLDTDTEPQNNIHCWYDARVGRWLSEEPIGFNGGDGNLSRYVKNRVVQRVDPYGLQELRAGPVIRARAEIVNWNWFWWDTLEVQLKLIAYATCDEQGNASYSGGTTWVAQNAWDYAWPGVIVANTIRLPSGRQGVEVTWYDGRALENDGPSWEIATSVSGVLATILTLSAPQGGQFVGTGVVFAGQVIGGGGEFFFDVEGFWMFKWKWLVWCECVSLGTSTVWLPRAKASKPIEWLSTNSWTYNYYTRYIPEY